MRIDNISIIDYYKSTYDDKDFDEIPESIIQKCKTEDAVDKIVKKWNRESKEKNPAKRHQDKYVLYPMNPDGTPTGGSTYGMVDYYDDQNDW